MSCTKARGVAFAENATFFSVILFLNDEQKSSDNIPKEK